MTTLDELIRPQPDVPSHPRLRGWKKRLSQPGVQAKLELYRPPTALGLVQTEMELQFTKDGQPQPDELVAWDDDLNAGLIRSGHPIDQPRSRSPTICPYVPCSFADSRTRIWRRLP